MSTNEPEKMTAQQEVPFEGVTCECTADGTVPDYLPEIRRVLSVRAEAIPGGQYTGQNRAECAGSCRFTVIYADPEGKMAAVEATGDFECGVPLGGADPSAVSVNWEAEAETPVCRLGGPRKFSLRTTVCCRAKLWMPGPDSLLPPASEGDALEALRKEMTAREVAPFTSDAIPLSGTERCDAAGEVRILFCEGRVLVRECTPENGVLLCRGEVRVSVLCEPESGSAFPLTVRIPFEEAVADLLPEEECRAVCRGYLTECSCTVSEDGTGERSVTADVAMVLDGYRMRRARIAPVTDLFSVHCPCHVQYSDCDVWENLGATCNCFTLDGFAEREEGAEEAVSVADTYIAPAPVRLSASGNMLTAEAEAKVQMILLSAPDEEGRTIPFPVSFTAPLKMEVQLPTTIPADAQLTGHLTLTAPHGRLDRNRLFFDTEACLSVSVDTVRREQVALHFTADCEHPFPTAGGGTVTAVYLQDGDTLWQVAKRYHTPTAAIAESNALPPEALQSPDEAYTLDGYVKLLIEE